MKEINLFPMNSARLLRPLNKLIAVGLAVRTVFAVVTQNPVSVLLVIGGLFCFRELSLSCHIYISCGLPVKAPALLAQKGTCGVM